MKILKKSELGDIELKGTTKLYYSQFPYKVRLNSNSVEFSEDNRSLYKWFAYHGDCLEGETDDQKLERVWRCKFVNSFTRHAYFEKKEYLMAFLKDFGDIVNQVIGPISKKHITALEEISKSRDTYNLKVIRDRNYYTEYDCKIKFNPYKWREPYSGHFGIRSQVGALAETYAKRFAYLTKLQNFVEDIVGADNCVKNYFNVYLRKEDVEEVAMYMKLKYPDSIQNVTEVIVIENLNNR